MKRFLIVMTILQMMSVFACAVEKDSPLQELNVPNVDRNSPACRVSFPASSAKCTNEICEIPAPKTSSLKSVRLSFSCIPTAAPTGFENPSPNEKVYSIQAQNVKGHVSLIDEPPEEPGERMRELYFCLYGETARFCGFAKTLLLKDGKSADASKNIIKFVKTMTLMSGDLSK
jgi:hypothetical protein